MTITKLRSHLTVLRFQTQFWCCPCWAISPPEEASGPCCTTPDELGLWVPATAVGLTLPLSQQGPAWPCCRAWSLGLGLRDTCSAWPSAGEGAVPAAVHGQPRTLAALCCEDKHHDCAPWEPFQMHRECLLTLSRESWHGWRAAALPAVTVTWQLRHWVTVSGLTCGLWSGKHSPAAKWVGSCIPGRDTVRQNTDTGLTQ